MTQTLTSVNFVQCDTNLENRFSTGEKLTAEDENELTNLGKPNEIDRACTRKQAHCVCDKENIVLTEEIYVSEHRLEKCYDLDLGQKPKCNLSSTVISRISCLCHPSYNELINANDTIQISSKNPKDENNDKIQKLIESFHKRRINISDYTKKQVKSLSDTILSRKKIVAGTDRLKRLTPSKSFIKRQTKLVTKKASSISDKVLNPITKIKHKLDSKFINNIQLKSGQIVLNNLSISDQNKDEPASNVQLIPTFVNKQFKLGTPTSFLTRSLGHYDHTK